MSTPCYSSNTLCLFWQPVLVLAKRRLSNSVSPSAPIGRLSAKEQLAFLPHLFADITVGSWVLT